MGKLRTNSTDDFPVESRDGGISYILIHPPETKTKTKRTDDGNLERVESEQRYSHYKSTKTEKTSLLKKLRSMDGYSDVTLLGIWTGRHRTDTHVLKLPEFIERMESAEL